eukprot:GHVU01156887.1.p1 GENE.GHVU01156887.1~~GHVU01156887.1.p1  ORF type:complete len:134 (+),score=33.98 GHVU01156887.1:184-585(+)
MRHFAFLPDLIFLLFTFFLLFLLFILFLLLLLFLFLLLFLIIIRYLERGWDAVRLDDMNGIYDFYLDQAEVQRIQRLELFDEMEEWRLLQGHYFILVAMKFQSSSLSPPLSHSSSSLAAEQTNMVSLPTQLPT